VKQSKSAYETGLDITSYSICIIDRGEHVLQYDWWLGGRYQPG